MNEAMEWQVLCQDVVLAQFRHATDARSFLAQCRDAVHARAKDHYWYMPIGADETE